MTVVVVVLALLVAALAVCVLVSNRQILASHTDLVRAVMAKNGAELAMMERAARKPAPAQAEVTQSQVEEFIARSISEVEGAANAPAQPAGFDGY